MSSTALRFFLFVSLLTWLIHASPIRPATEPTGGQASFRVPRARSLDLEGRNAQGQLLKAYRKHRMPIPRGLQEFAASIDTEGRLTVRDSRHANDTTGLVPATPYGNGIEYVSPITIGGQSISVDFDTGSSDLWVFSSLLDNRVSAGHQIYDHNKSSTFTMLHGSSFNCSYGDGSGVAGAVGSDKVEVGGVTATQQAVGMATAVSREFADDMGSHGLVGLAFSSINRVQPEQQKTFFDNVMPDLAEPVFTADLRKTEEGAYEFGRIDSTKYTGELAWVPVKAESGYWQFTSDSFVVGQEPQQTNQRGSQAIADTGTTAILAHPATVEHYYAQVEGAENNTEHGGFTFPCDTELPDLSLDIGGAFMARIPGRDIKFSQFNDEMCFGGLQTATSDVQVYGDIMFKSHFMAFNGANKSIGIAEHAFMEQQNDDHSQSGGPDQVAMAQQSGSPTNLTEENYQPAHGKQ